MHMKNIFLAILSLITLVSKAEYDNGYFVSLTFYLNNGNIISAYDHLHPIQYHPDSNYIDFTQTYLSKKYKDKEGNIEYYKHSITYNYHDKSSQKEVSATELINKQALKWSKIKKIVVNNYKVAPYFARIKKCSTLQCG